MRKGETRQRAYSRFNLVAPISIGGIGLALGILGGLFANTGEISGVNRFVEVLAGQSGAGLGNLADLLPLSVAFAAGMLSTVNPCGFAMLPAYLGMYLGANDRGEATESVPKRLGRALKVGGVVSIGFVFLFTVTGIVAGTGAQTIVRVFPWAGFITGVLLIIGGSWLIRGGTFYTTIGVRAASTIGNPNNIGNRGYFLFGMSYGIASLSCVLPIFLTVTGIGFLGASDPSLGKDILAAIVQFFAYAAGMGIVILALTVSIALFKSGVARMSGKILPYIQPASALLMVAAGTYITFYWLTVGGLLENRT